MSVRNLEDIYELSPAQHGILFHTLYAPDSGVYLNQLSYTLHGNLNVSAFKRAWQRVIDRHAALRTSFFWQNLQELDKPLQLVHIHAQLPWEQQDWREFSLEQQEEKLSTFLEQDRKRGFDLTQPPLMRITLIRMSDDSYRFIWSEHHLVLDGWSLPLILKEVFACYEAFCHGQEPHLRGSRLYRDYIMWLQEQDLARAEAYWRSMLKDFTVPPPLYIDRKPAGLPGSQTEDESFFEEQEMRLPTTTTADLQSLAKQLQLTLNTLLQGAWALLLSHYSGEEDIVYGVAVSGRPPTLEDVESMVGMFMNTLPMRVQVRPAMPLRSWLKMLQEQQIELRQYEYSSLVQVQQWSEVAHHLPLFETLFAFENFPMDSTRREHERSSGLTMRSDRSIGRTHYPLTVAVSPQSQLYIEISYDRRRFERIVITRMLGHLRTLLENFVVSVGRPLAELSLLSEDEQRQLLIEWNNTLVRAGQEDPAVTSVTSVPAAFRQQAQRTLDSIALVCGDEQLTYEELDQRSNRLAHYLQRLGIGREMCVGVCLDRSIELAVALLGIMKAGGVYLPLDPGYPHERLALMLAQTQASIVLTRTPYQKLFEQSSAHIVCIETPPIEMQSDGSLSFQVNPEEGRREPIYRVWSGGPGEPPSLEIHPANAAYIIYTSGSTGIPKGVVVPYSALLNHIDAVRSAYALQPQDRILQFSSPNFDVSLEELLPSWLSGSCVVIWPEVLVPPPSELMRFVDLEGLTVLNLPSSYWHAWVAELQQEGADTHVAQRGRYGESMAGSHFKTTHSRTDPPANLRLVVIGSEQASMERLAIWQCIVGERVALQNAYGLTETAITCLINPPASESRREGTSAVPVGRPLANMQAYVLNTARQPVPVGIPGELYIGGACLARSYLHNPGITAERFVPHPFSALPGARLYRTGDRARYLPGGNIELLGRTDTQVKIRGFRIEPGEIEARLLQHPAVREVVVQARENRPHSPTDRVPADLHLVAYIVAREKEQVPSLLTTLRHYLQGVLPAYMVPAIFVPLKTLPRTSTGKVDAHALPSPEQELLQPETYSPLRNPQEEILASIWSEVLGLERVGRNDHFFQLGGHSLQTIQVIARVRAMLQVELPVRAIFDAPTLADLAARIEQERRLADKQLLPAIECISRDAPLPLSFAQQRLWFLDQLQPGNPFYNVASAFSITGSLVVQALQHSLQDLVQRHEALRTTFSTSVGSGATSGQAVQIIAPTLQMQLPVIQLLCEAEATRQEESIARLVHEEAVRPFDLARGPLIRATLLRLNEREHVFLLTLHHIVADGWSADILFQELWAVYSGYVHGQPLALPPLPIQYADYAAWQRSWLQGEVLEQQLSYWREQLAGVPPVLALPTDRPRPSMQSFNGALYALTLPFPLVQQLQTLSREEGVTLFMTLLAGLQGLLFRYTSQTDIVVGTPSSGRIHRETEDVIGLFLNMLVLRTQITGNLTFRELLQRVRDVALGAYMHQDVPFEKLVEELRVERSLSHGPLFQVMLAFQNTPVKYIERPDLHLKPLPTLKGTAQFDLAFELYETPTSIQGTVEYSTDIFDEATVARMVGHLQTLLDGCVANPDIPLAELSLLTPAERLQILHEWSTTPIPQPGAASQQACIHTLFEAQVDRTPEAVAVMFEQEQITYGELDARANQLAHYLRDLGVESETQVGLYLESSIELVIGILGILKAGGAYMPLDPHYPRTRLAFMLQDAQAPVLLTQSHLLKADRPSSLTLPAQTAILCLDRDWLSIGQESATRPGSNVRPENLAYVIYTSGSTGRPKGTLVSHHNIVSSTRARFAYYRDAVSRYLPLYSFAFDSFVAGFFWTLCQGGSIVLPPPSFQFDLSRLPDLIAHYQVSHLDSIPSLYDLILTQAEPGKLASLRTVIVGGETCPPEVAGRHAGQLPGVDFFNEYGPTEATVWSAVYRYSTQDGHLQLPLGHPIPGAQVYILNPHMNPVPVGVPGELYVGGSGLARGYSHQPGLTAEHFLPHPFSQVPGMRLYRTGDRGRYLPDGSLEFLGRIDDQIKLRGYRIELGEIEAVLGQHPSLREVAVAVQENGPGNKQLVAYIVPAHEEGPALSELRTFLQERLPSYMLPGVFMWLPALPLTPQGKVDRRALPALEQQHAELGESQALRPRNLVEEILVDLWSQLLQQEEVGVEQNFFDLGGHSLLATQLIYRIRDLFHVDIPLRTVFEAPTVTALALRLEQMLLANQGVEKLPLVPVSREQPLPLSFAQQRLWFLDRLEPGDSAYNIPLALRLRGPLNIEALARSLYELERRHESLRTIFPDRDGQPEQVITSVGVTPLQHIDLSMLPSEDCQRVTSALAAQEAQLPFDLSRGPLIRTKLLWLSAGEHVLLFTLHHIVSDGWSMGILENELLALYTAFLSGEPSPLPPLPVQYADFAYCQRQWLSDEPLQMLLRYWKQQLEHVPVLDLPTDRPRPAVRTNNGDARSLHLPPALYKQLRALSLQEGTTLFMTLLAAFQVLLARYSGQEDIIVGSPVANRTHPGVENIVGFFINMLALRTNFSAHRAMTFRELLQRVREVCLQAYTYQDLPFEQLVELLQPDRNLSRSPLFQVTFALNYVTSVPFAKEPHALHIEALREEQIPAKYDLSLEITASDQELACTLVYSTDLFVSATIERLLRHWQTLLQGIVDDPQQFWTVLPLLTEQERQQLLMAWNAPESNTVPVKCFHELFEAQVERVPEALAVVCENTRLNYRQIDSRANQLAHYLREQGVGPEVCVGICLERSPDLVLALLAVLKAGGTYVPLDPAYPQWRLAYLIADAHMPFVLTSQQLVERLPDAVRHICLDRDWTLIVQHSTQRLESTVVAASAAYVIYTSGSTGAPKGVIISHRGLTNYIAWASRYYTAAEGNGSIVHTSIAFDLTITSLFAPLACGGYIHLVPENQGIEALGRILRRDTDFSLLKITPAHLEMLNTTLPAEELTARVRTVVVGGENLLSASLVPWRVQAPSTRFINEYGPTETVVGCCIYEVHGPETLPTNVPIGRPIANTQLYVLDRYLQPVPIGVAGELYIGGYGVARGYLNLPDRTAEQFLPHPFSKEPGARLYKTGDLARYLPNGEIEFLGRIDSQVKIRGFRIELGEIEAALVSHPAVQESVVLAREVPSEARDRHLVAYVVLKESLSSALTLLWQYLKNRLPDYMLPASIIVLDALPLTSNGKVDRRALLIQQESRQEVVDVAAPPCTSTEEALAQIWGELLQRNVSSLSRHSNFFELGGHSLLATRLIAHVRRDLQVEMPLQALFEHPTIAGFAEAITERELEMADSELLDELLEQFEKAPGTTRE